MVVVDVLTADDGVVEHGEIAAVVNDAFVAAAAVVVVELLKER